MIAVDLFGSLFDLDEQDRDRLERGIGTASRLVRLARGKAVPGPLVFIDAGLSLLDALGAYARYRQTQEITRQLEIEGDRLEQLFLQLGHQRAALRDVDAARHAKRLADLREEVSLGKLQLDLQHADLVELSLHIKMLGGLISQQRLQAPPHCVPLLKLEREYYRLFDSLLFNANDLLPA